MASKEENIRVAVRIRPLLKFETSRGCKQILEKILDQPKIRVKNSKTFKFDHVYSQYTSQESIYETAVKDLVDSFFQGYNITVISYGQTGTGKTYTMGSTFNGQFDADVGVIPRAVNEMFDRVEEMTEYSFEASCSFMELYQEQLYDLLSNSDREGSVVDILEDESKEIITQGLTETVVASAAETMKCLMKGSARRAVGATAMNEDSSRSHTIFTISVLKMKKSDPNATTWSTFHFVDLAGSQRSKKTKDTGDRFKEGIKIKQGHLALKNVISALGSPQGAKHVGYRDSKLTRLLRNALGGNSITLIIACVSPADYNEDETLSTLRYADQTRRITNKPIVDHNPKAAQINRLNKIINRLRQELASKNVADGATPEQQNETDNIEHVVSIIDKEIDAILSVIDAKFSLDKLMEERIILALEFENVKKGDLRVNKNDSMKLEKEIQRNKACITDMQKKILAFDTETKMTEICKVINNALEGKAAVRHVVERLINMKNEMNMSSKQIAIDSGSSSNISDDKISELENQMSALQIQHLEEKTSAFGQIEAMRDEIETYKKKIQKLTKDIEHQQYIKLPRKSKNEKKEGVVNEDEGHDPVKASQTRTRGNVSREQEFLDMKKPSEISFRCSCKGDCTKKICTCRKNSSTCSENCKCTEICANRDGKLDIKVKSTGFLKIKLLQK